MAKPAAKAISAIKTTPVIPILAAENVRNDCLLRHTRTLVAMRQRIAREERHRNGQHFAGGVCGSGRFRSPPRATGVEEKCRIRSDSRMLVAKSPFPLSAQIDRGF